MAELVRSIRLKSLDLVPSLARVDTNHAPGAVDSFSVIDFTARRVSTVTAELRLSSPSAYFYVEDGLTVSQRALELSAVELERTIVPAVRRYVNPAWLPGAGVDSRMTILVARLAGMAGYVSSLDLLPKKVHPHSNQRPVVYTNLFAALPGTDRYYALLAHEVQHLAHMQASPHQKGWLQEGASELLVELAGYPVNLHHGYLADPDVHLLNWDSHRADIGRHYGAAYLFVRFLGAQVGYDQLPLMFSSARAGMDGVEDLLHQISDPRTIDRVFRDWTLANVLAGLPMPGEELYSYRSPFPGPGRVPNEPVSNGLNVGSSSQYAVSYARLDPSPVSRTMAFDGESSVNLLDVSAPSGARFWWSNRGDHIETSLTQTFDLSAVERATLTFKLWYDIEDQFDFAYVLASRDGGLTWDTLQGSHTTVKNTLGQSLGHGYTGKGGEQAAWLNERIDLGAYAGRSVMLRFQYITDEGIHHPGLAVDDVAIPEIGFYDDAESNAGWDAEGFFRSDNRVSQRFLVTIILTDTREIMEVTLDSANDGSAEIPATRPAVLVITGLAPLTSVRAEYRYTVYETR